jgi:uncharacterized protein (TIGR03435 family)
VLPVLIVGATASVLAQTPVGPTFDVVSIKRHIPGPGAATVFSGTQNQRPDGGFTMTNTRIVILIARAYPEAIVLPTDIVGLPGWATSESYDVSATSTLKQATASDRTAIMRAVLADRFKLVAHVEPREQVVRSKSIEDSDTSTTSRVSAGPGWADA